MQGVTGRNVPSNGEMSEDGQAEKRMRFQQESLREEGAEMGAKGSQKKPTLRWVEDQAEAQKRL